MRTPDLWYAIDEEDRLVEASDGFFEFAAENGWRNARASVGKPLWESVSGSTARSVQMALARRVRDTGRTVSLPFRCDSPDVRREMTMTIEPRDGTKRVVFTAVTVSEQPRARQSLLDPDRREDEPALEMCGWCDRCLVDGAWVEIEQAVELLGLTDGGTLPRISHGICDSCAQLLARA